MRSTRMLEKDRGSLASRRADPFEPRTDHAGSIVLPLATDAAFVHPTSSMTGPFSSKRRPHTKRVAAKVLRHWSQGFKRAEDAPPRVTSPSSWILLSTDDIESFIALEMASTSQKTEASKVAEQLGYTSAFAPYLLCAREGRGTPSSTIVGVDACTVSPGPMNAAYDEPLPHNDRMSISTLSSYTSSGSISSADSESLEERPETDSLLHVSDVPILSPSPRRAEKPRILDHELLDRYPREEDHGAGAQCGGESRLGRPARRPNGPRSMSK